MFVEMSLGPNELRWRSSATFFRPDAATKRKHDAASTTLDRRKVTYNDRRSSPRSSIAGFQGISASEPRLGSTAVVGSLGLVAGCLFDALLLVVGVGVGL
jgi:hypothetical protein